MPSLLIRNLSVVTTAAPLRSMFVGCSHRASKRSLIIPKYHPYCDNPSPSPFFAGPLPLPEPGPLPPVLVLLASLVAELPAPSVFAAVGVPFGLSDGVALGFGS